MKKHVQKIVTLGPATNTEHHLAQMKTRGVDFVRVNMSHSSLEEMERFMDMAGEAGIPFIVDTEGSQVRTGKLESSPLHFIPGDEFRIYAEARQGDKQSINLTPPDIVGKLSPGDILYIDFDVLVARITDVSQFSSQGFVTASVISGGSLGERKGVYIDTASGETYVLPTLSEKDYQAIKIGLARGVGHLAASFMRSGEDVREVRRASGGKMKIISKVECTDALRNLDEIIDQSDAILIDRGDLSKEIFLTRIPFTQKIIVHRARRKGKPVIVATNFLESMIQNRKPTRAEIHDIESSITDGASGLTLAAETAIGKYPIECINVMNQVIHHITSAVDVDAYADKEEKLVNYLEGQNYLLDFENHSPLIRPHGGKLINRFLVGSKDETRFPTLPRVALNQEQEMDAEQIGVGVYSPLEGFMSREELASVLDSMRLPSNIVWPLPIVLDVSEQVASSFREGDDVLLLDRHRQPLAILRLKEKYKFDKKEFAEKLYATLDENHPGVRTVLKMKEVFLGGPIDLLRRRESETRELEMTPSQSRRLFESLGWQRVVGFHTRNVIHRGHEFIQLEALRRTASDGVFVHPVVGKKKAGDFYPKPIVKCYTEMVRNFYSPNTVCLAAFPSYSRYAGPREALFTALCRQNYGCSHFIVGRDHTGVGKFYKPTASHDIFEEVEGIDITPVKFGEVFYSAKLKRHVEADETQAHLPEEKLNISGTEARQMFLRGEAPPEWFMRPEISRGVLDMVAAGEKVFVDEGNAPSGVTVWFTGLSGSGKTTIAQALKERLESAGKSVAVFDGDVVREKYHKNLDFSREGIRENNRLIAELVREARGKHDFILVPIISPYRDDRRVVRRTIGSPFLELYVNAPLEECIKRDVKGLYAKALAGQLQRMIGLSDENPYEPPLYPDLEVQTVGKSVEEVVDDIMRELK